MVLREDQFVPLTGDIDWCVCGGGAWIRMHSSENCITQYQN